jgi:hypothetical protein
MIENMRFELTIFRWAAGVLGLAERRSENVPVPTGNTLILFALPIFRLEWVGIYRADGSLPKPAPALGHRMTPRLTFERFR